MLVNHQGLGKQQKGLSNESCRRLVLEYTVNRILGGKVAGLDGRKPKGFFSYWNKKYIAYRFLLLTCSVIEGISQKRTVQKLLRYVRTPFKQDTDKLILLARHFKNQVRSTKAKGQIIGSNKLPCWLMLSFAGDNKHINDIFVHCWYHCTYIMIHFVMVCPFRARKLQEMTQMISLW